MPKVNYGRLWEFVKDFFAMNLGMAVYALGWAAFLLPYHITTGGMTGMFAIVYYLTKFPIAAAVLISNAILLLIAFKPLGWKFVSKSAYAAVALSFFLEMGQQMMTDDAGNLIQILGEGQDSMACVLGAVLNGLGLGIVFLSGGSTGGWDIIAALVNKYRNISFGRALLYLDFLVIGSCWPIFHDWRMVVFGYVTLAVYTYVLDMLINSARQDVQFIIFTNKLPLRTPSQFIPLRPGRYRFRTCQLIWLEYSIIHVFFVVSRPQCTTWQPKINVFCITDTKIDGNMFLTILISICITS